MHLRMCDSYINTAKEQAVV